MKVLVTGGSGFLGSHVADALTEQGHNVIIYDKKKSIWIQKNQNFFLGNIMNYEKTSKVVRGVKAIFHLAALSDLEDAMFKPLQTVRNNILGTVNILELARKFKVKRVIYASSIYSTSIQGGFYRCSKRASEDYIEEFNKRYGLEFTILRYGSLYGPRSGLENGIFRVTNSIIKKKKIFYTGKKNSIRKYIHVKDAAKATAQMILPKYKNLYINITGKKSYKVTDLFKLVSNLFNIKYSVKYGITKDTGHYIKSPKPFKIKKGLNYKFRKSISLKQGIEQLISSITKR